MKILLINTSFNKGGAAKIANALYQALNEKDEIKCYFAYGRGEKIDNEKIIRFTYLPEVYFQGLLTRFLGLQGYGSWFSTRRLIKFIIKEKFDLIHLHNLHGYYLDSSFIYFLKKMKIPVIWTLHDGWPITGRCANWFNCEKWKVGCGDCPDLSLYPKTFIDSSFFMWKKKREWFGSEWDPVIICPSQWLADQVKESYLRKYQVKVVPNAVDSEIFKPKHRFVIRREYKIPTKKKVILFMAADLKNELKGVRYFLKTLKYINTKNYMVITVGNKINLNEEIRFNFNIKQLGYIKDKNILSKIYNIADIFCICSLDDNFPTTVLEALACGVPVVGFKVGGITEQVTKDCGMLVNPRDVKALANAIEKLLNNDELRRNFGENCRKRELENYTIDKFADNYINTYNKVLGRIK